MLRTIVLLAQVLLLAQVTSGLAADGVGPFDGQWTGSATPTVQKCKQGNVTVTVEGTTVIGQAQFANDAPNINGTVREDGGFGATIGWQPLTGKFVADGFEGTFKNGDCEWQMRLQRSQREHLLPITRQPKQISAGYVAPGYAQPAAPSGYVGAKEPSAAPGTVAVTHHRTMYMYVPPHPSGHHTQKIAPATIEPWVPGYLGRAVFQN